MKSLTYETYFSIRQGAEEGNEQQTHRKLDIF